jgi:hypothetical protein
MNDGSAGPSHHTATHAFRTEILIDEANSASIWRGIAALPNDDGADPDLTAYPGAYPALIEV